MSKSVELVGEDLYDDKKILSHVLMSGIGCNSDIREEVMKTEGFKKRQTVEFKIMANGVELDVANFVKLIEDHIKDVEDITTDKIETKAKHLLEDRFEQMRDILESDYIGDC